MSRPGTNSQKTVFGSNSRDDIVTSMCYTWDHAYGAPVDPNFPGLVYSDEQRQHLWNQMAQIFDNDISPHMSVGPYDIPQPEKGWQTEFTEKEKAKLRPIAETLAMLDGNAFFGNSFERDDRIVEWYEMYLPQAAALYESNGGDQGWAGESSIAKNKKDTPRPPVGGEEIPII